MRLIALLTYIFAACLWGQTGHADIYVWIDENDIKHFTNENPPPHAEVLMRTKEIPYDEASDLARREAEKRQELLQAEAEMRQQEARLAEQQAELQRRIAEADRRAEEARQGAEDLSGSANDRYEPDRWYDSYAYYPANYRYRHYRSLKYYYRSDGGIYYHKRPKFRHGGIHKKFNSGRQHFQKGHFKSGGGSQFRHHAGGRARSHGHLRSGFGRRY